MRATIAFLCLLAALLGPGRAQAQDGGPDTGRDRHFDDRLLFTEPWLRPIDLDAFVPKPNSNPRPTYAQSWLAAAEHQKRSMLLGFADQVVFQCMANLGDTPKGQACVRSLLPLPVNDVLAAVDGIYRDRAYADKRYDFVIQAALRKIVGEDWRGYLASVR